MSKVFVARRLDLQSFADERATLAGHAPLRELPRLLAETEGRRPESPVNWSAHGELRNPHHVQPEIWLHLNSSAILALTCQRCLGEVDVPVSVERSFRFVPDEEMAAAQDEQSQEDVLAMSRSFDLIELVEDELLMELPLAPRHESCPVPVKLAVADEDFESASALRHNPFALLGKPKPGKP